MRILVVTNLGPVGGNPSGGVFIPPRLQGLRNAGADVHLFYPRPHNWVKTRGRLARDLAAVEMANMSLADHTRLSWQPRVVKIPLLSYLRARNGRVDSGIGRIATVIDRAAPDVDVIHAHGLYLPFPAARVAQRLAHLRGVEYVVTAHGSDINMVNERSLPALREVAADASAVFFVSQALANAALSSGIVAKYAAITPNGFDPTVFCPAPATARRSKRVLFVGNLSHVKGADRLPGIMRFFWRNADAELRIIGDGPLRESLRSSFTGQPVSILGRLSQSGVAEEMRTASVLLLPSRSEGWPTVVLEAHACGLPVVATRVGGTSEAVGDPRMTVDRFEPSEFAALAASAMMNGDAEALADRARDFTWESLGKHELQHIRRATLHDPGVG